MNGSFFTHIFELIPGMDTPLPLKLSDMNSFLSSHDDKIILDKLVRYDVPLTWEVLSHESVSFLCVTVKEGITNKLNGYAPIFTEGCAAPHLTTLLRNGYNHRTELIKISKSDYETDADTIVGNALRNDGIYIINSRTGGEKKSILKKIIVSLLGLRENDIYKIEADLSLYEYKNIKQTLCEADLSHTVQIEKIINNFKALPYTHKNALEALENIYKASFTVLDGLLLQELNRCKDEVLLNNFKNQPLKDKNESSNQKKAIMDLLGKINQAVLSHGENANRQKNELLIRYIENINQEMLDKYINHESVAHPLLYKDTAVIDMDTCVDEPGITAAVMHSKHIIMAGSYINGLYKLFFDAALRQQRIDRQNRIGVYRTAINQHPKLSAFIGRNFNERKIPDADNSHQPKNNLPVFVWLSPEAINGMKFSSFLDMLTPELKIGMVTFEKGKAAHVAGQLQTAGYDPSAIKTGSEQELHGGEFDVLLLVLDDMSTDVKKLYLSMVMAIQTVVIIGDHRHLENGSVLKKFYFLCEGDRLHGRVYH
jgi:hypothetical protein